MFSFIYDVNCRIKTFKVTLQKTRLRDLIY
jgi:hypothetical protein